MGQYIRMSFHVLYLGRPEVNTTAPIEAKDGVGTPKGMARDFSQVLEWIKQTILIWLLF